MYVKYACTYIKGIKVILGTNGFCNIPKHMYDHNGDTKIQSWGISIRGTRIKLSRLMAHLFIDSTFDIIEQRDKGKDRVVVFINENPLDLRVDNIQIMTHKESVNRHHRVEDDIYLINLEGKYVDSGCVNELSAKYGVNNGSLYDAARGVNSYCKLNTGEKCIVIRGKDYNRDKVKDRIKELSNKRGRRFKNDEIIIQADINGKTREITVKEACIVCNEAGLRMCLNGKRKSAGGYLWFPLDKYNLNPNCVTDMLNEVKSSKFYGNKIKLNSF